LLGKDCAAATPDNNDAANNCEARAMLRVMVMCLLLGNV
jgi:hypothetical protein